jgi:hypothetical protein
MEANEEEGEEEEEEEGASNRMKGSQKTNK